MKKRTKIIGLTLASGLLITGIVIAARVMWIQKWKNDSVSSDKSVSDNKEMFTDYDTEKLIKNLKKENYYDERSGLIFHIPDGFTVEDQDEYLIMKNSDHPNGCIVVYLYSDMNVHDGIETFDALYGLKDRTAYCINGNYHKCVLYDVGTFSLEKINGNDCRVETTTIHLKDLEPAECRAAYYHTAIEGSAVCIGSVVKSDSDETEISYFDDQVHEVLNNISPVHYLGVQPGGNAQYMSLSADKVNGITLQYPTGWNKYNTMQGCTVYKSKAAKADQYQNAAILVTKISADTTTVALNEEFNAINILRWKLGYSIGDALCQNSEIENYFSFSSLIQNSEELMEINGYTFKHVTCTGKLDLTEAKKISTLPEKDNISVDAYFVTIDEDTHCFIFLGSTVRNNVEMEILSKRCLEAIR